MNRRFAKCLLFLATLATIAACIGCVRGSPDSWTVVVRVLNEREEPCPNVLVDVKSGAANGPRPIPYTNHTNRDGLAFVRVRAGDSIWLSGYDNMGLIVEDYTTVCIFGISTEGIE